MARDLKSRVLQGGHHVGPVPHHAVLDPLLQVVPEQLARVLVLQAGPQARRLDEGPVSGLLHPGPLRVVRPAPAVLVVTGVAQRVERPPPAGRRHVQAPARLQVAPGGEDVHVDAAAALAVLDRRPGVAVGLEPRPCRLLELVEHRLDLLVGRAVVRRPRDHAGRVLVLELQRVGDVGDHVGIAAENRDALPRLAGRVALAEQVVGRRAGRAGAAGDELNVHRRPRVGGGPAPRAPARWRPGGR